MTRTLFANHMLIFHARTFSGKTTPRSPCFLLLLTFVMLTGICPAQKDHTSSKPRTWKHQQLTGIVVGIVDGDTYDLKPKGRDTTVRIRMEGIDAPEKGMAFGKAAKIYLGRLCFQQRVRTVVSNPDRNGRLVAFTYLTDGRELSHEMIRAGYAWHFKKYNQDKDLAILENEARKARRGLWSDPDPQAPWDYRHPKRNHLDR